MKRTLTILAAVFLLHAAAFAKRTAPTLTGQVTCDGKPVAGVYVSDGTDIAFTDKKGWYRLDSDKHLGSVFVSFPGGYEVAHTHGMPANWQKTDAANPTVPERHDFVLRKVDNRNHVILAFSDAHMQNAFCDWDQFREVFMPRVREEIAKYDVPVYAINAGDSSYDLYWYETDYAMKDWVKTLADVDFPLATYTVMGNHDNDPATPAGPDADRRAEQAYRDAMGPTWFSLNLGDVHYIFLDNIEYHNSKGRIDVNEGIVGKRDYKERFNDEEIAWLRKDLATVKDKSTPIVMTIHAPLFAYRNGRSDVFCRMDKAHPEVADSLANAFTSLTKDFEQVHYITGHTHKNIVCHGADADTTRFHYLRNVIDHNITGVCGCWWQTAAWGGLTLAPDSGPAGFSMFPVDGKNLQWYFVSEDDGADEQFRVFDLNEVRKYYSEHDDVMAFVHHNKDFFDFSSDSTKDQVLVHVWAWEPGWKVTATENGKPVEVKWRKFENPQFTVSYDIPRRNWHDKRLKKEVTPTKATHMFLIQTSAPDTPVTVSVTDNFGKTWTRTVQRPKAFFKKMK